ncbi:Os03g0644250 [Oryza sativa Japonica Group]|uniref:Os03g0644250 protein n=1 Tax=Oryza sativa subsp. japonica TaxID=39947 RepID=C7IZN8_ORYSJ|nr:Os03g0644250 [Oryza sativa Japonica Group]|eukprot:NP_001173563.1 Os03g0644250 [Oryza sativa Japonica Group]
MVSRKKILGMERRSCSSAWQGAEERTGDEDTVASIGWSRGLLGLFGVHEVGEHIRETEMLLAVGGLDLGSHMFRRWW